MRLSDTEETLIRGLIIDFSRKGIIIERKDTNTTARVATCIHPVFAGGEALYATGMAYGEMFFYPLKNMRRRVVKIDWGGEAREKSYSILSEDDFTDFTFGETPEGQPPARTISIGKGRSVSQNAYLVFKEGISLEGLGKKVKQITSRWEESEKGHQFIQAISDGIQAGHGL